MKSFLRVILFFSLVVFFCSCVKQQDTVIVDQLPEVSAVQGDFVLGIVDLNSVKKYHYLQDGQTVSVSVCDCGRLTGAQYNGSYDLSALDPGRISFYRFFVGNPDDGTVWFFNL